MSASSGDTGKKIRVLALAELANPEWNSVPLLGWSHSQALAKVTDLHLVTNLCNRENILKAGLEEGRDFTAIDTSALDNPALTVAKLLGADPKKDVGWSTLTALSSFAYYWFEHRVWQIFEARLRRGEFDVVHRITPLSPAKPSLIAPRLARIGVPFVVGPLNGGLPWPKGFTRERLKEREFLGYARELYRYLPGYTGTRRDAACIIAGSRNAAQQVPARWRDRTVYVPENSVDPARFDTVVTGAATLPLRVVFVGRLVPVKCIDILLEAAAPLVRDKKVVLDIIGDGPCMPALKEQAARERLGEGCTFAGWLQHRAVKPRLIESRVLAFPSVRDFGGGAVLEAMAIGLVPIVVDHGGPPELVSPRSGFVIPMGPRQVLVDKFRSILESLVADPSVLEPMGQCARQRVLDYFTWDKKAAQVLEIYRWVLGRRERPDFGMPFPDM